MLKGKLNRLKQHMSINQVEQTVQRASVKEKIGNNHVPFLKKWEELGAHPAWFDGQYTMIRDTHYPLDHQHGRYQFSELKKVLEVWQEHLAAHPLSAKGRQVEDLLFFDTETTGLSSGAGNSIFLLGFSQVREHDVFVRQYFLPGPEAEVSMYHHFLTDVGQLKNLVTYNGKAFDWPQVKTRHTFVRDQVPKLPKFGHFDLLHASRRLWKELLPTCKLSVVESDILNFKREEDTPSYLVPMLYFDFVQEEDPELIKGVLQHHEWDVLSLITLYTHLSKLITEKEHGSLHPREAYELARWYEYVGEKEIALKLYEQQSQGEDSLALDNLFAFANLLKQNKRTEEALIAYRSLIEANHFLIESAIECSKIYEHQLKDIELALYFTKVAWASHKERTGLTKSKKEKRGEEIQKRLQRLELKASRT